MSTITYRWLDDPLLYPEDWERIENVMAARGWMSLNRYHTRILIADVNGQIAGFICLQMVPHLGPFFVVPSHRGTGVAEDLADKATGFMVEAEARGWIAVASNSIVAEMCEARGMKRIEHPVYIAVGGL